MASPPQTAYSIAANLHSTLTQTLSPLLASPVTASQHLHLLSTLPSPTSTRHELSAAFSSLRRACTTFSRQLDVAVAERPKAQTDKLVALLRETATSEAILRSHTDDVARAHHALDERAEYAYTVPVLSPELFNPADVAAQSLAILESIGNAVGLASFAEQNPTTGVHTLSLGGKVMVMDFDVDAGTGAVVKTKFSYGVLDVQHDDDDMARLLKDSVAGLEKAGEEEREMEIEQGLRTLRGIVGQLKSLDEMTDESQRDCFELVRSVTSSLASLVPIEGTTTPVYIPSRNNPFPLIVIHLPVPALLPSPAFPLHTLSSAHTLRISPVQPESATSPPSYLAKLAPPVPISAQTGQRILAALGRVSSDTETVRNGFKRRKIGTSSFGEVLLGSVEAATLTYTVKAYDDVATPFDFTLASTEQEGYLCTALPFSDPSHLLSALSVLKDQLLLNDALTSVLQPEHSPAPKASRSKRRKVEPLSLEDLFQSPLSSLPISVHYSSASSLILSFPLPHVPLADSRPLTLEISVVEGRYNVDVRGREEEAERVDWEKKLGRVLDVSRDLGLLVRAVWKELAKERMEQG